MKRFIPVTLALLYLLTSPFWVGIEEKAQAAFTATLTFANPGDGGSVTLNASNQFTIDANVNTAGQDSTGADVIVNFDSTKLDFVPAGSSISNFYPANHTGPTLSGGRIWMGATKTAGGSNVNGSGRFATLQFALKSGVTLPTNVTFSFYYISQGNTTDSNITSTDIMNPDLLAAPSPATITINAYVPSPTITSLVPNNGAAAGGYDVVINGTNFGTTAGTVRWNGNVITLKSGTSWSATVLTVVAPSGTAGSSVGVTVTTSGGLTSNSATFTYNAAANPPTITSLNPNNGPAAGGTSVTITGTNFGSTQGTSYVRFGTASPTSITSWSATSIVAVSPAGTAGTSVSVTVTTSAGTSNGVTFTYNAAAVNTPNISGINPNEGSENGGTLVTLTGTYFGTTEGTVSIGGITVSAANVTWSDTTITFTTPAYTVSADTPVSVYVVTASDAGSRTSNLVTFTYKNITPIPATTPDPVISYLNPNSGRADADVQVNIYGSNFKPTGTTTGTVRFGSYNATILDWTDTLVKVMAPKLGAIPADIGYQVVLTRSDGKSATAFYTYLAPPTTGGTPTPGTGLPTSGWLALISFNGGLAYWFRKRFQK